jgi:hypothetical protein
MEEQRMAEAYHRLMAGDTAEWGIFVNQLPGWTKFGLKAWLGMSEPLTAPAVSMPIGRGGELALLEEARFGTGFEVEGKHLRWVRTPTMYGASGLLIGSHDEPCLFNLKGSVYIENPMGIGISGRAAPLVLEIQEPREARVIFLPGVTPGLLGENTLLLPLSEEIDFWLKLPAGSSIRISSSAESALFDLEASTFRVAPASQAQTAPQVMVHEFFRPAIEARYGR